MTKREYENTSIKNSGVTGDSLLPVVVFNLSKKKCDEAADFLSSQDFITGAEKAEVHHLICYLIVVFLTFSFPFSWFYLHSLLIFSLIYS